MTDGPGAPAGGGRHCDPHSSDSSLRIRRLPKFNSKLNERQRLCGSELRVSLDRPPGQGLSGSDDFLNPNCKAKTNSHSGLPAQLGLA